MIERIAEYKTGFILFATSGKKGVEKYPPQHHQDHNNRGYNQYYGFVQYLACDPGTKEQYLECYRNRVTGCKF